MFSVKGRGIYADLMRKFKQEGHYVYIVYPRERQFAKPTEFYEEDGIHILGVKTLNLQKTNVVEKGIGTILFEYQFNSAIKKYLSNVKFDLILYSTPPITFLKVIKYLKTTSPKAVAYLLLKDIFPQNAVDMEMMGKSSILYKFFRNKEINLYKISDYIGCMSPANVEYILGHNNIVNPERIEVAPNSIELQEGSLVDKRTTREKYNLPVDKPIFIYGGNLGRPQGIDFLIQCLNANSERMDCHFLIIGNGTEYNKLVNWFKDRNPQSVSVHSRLPKEDYDKLVQSCDVGLIFLDHRFTIPNYPSRLLSYLEYKMPVLAATDSNTDIGRIAEKNGYGLWCESNDVSQFTKCVDRYVQHLDEIATMGERGYKFLLENYLVDNTYKTIISHL